LILYLLSPHIQFDFLPACLPGIKIFVAKGKFWNKTRVITMNRFVKSLFWIVIACLIEIPVEAQTSFTLPYHAPWLIQRWNNSADAPPYSSTYLILNNVSFTTGNYLFAGMGGQNVPVGNINVADNVTVRFSFGSGDYSLLGIRTFTIGTGSSFDFGRQPIVQISGNSGIIKNGPGALALGVAVYGGGFTLNAGTVIARDSMAMGSGATNRLTLNGGTIAADASRTFDNTRFGAGISIGGNVQVGAMATQEGLSSSVASLVFANNVSLGTENRTLTQGNDGSHGFTGVISNSASGGITFAAVAGTNGRFDITNNANTFTGNISINGGEVRFTADGSMGNSANDIIIDGGSFAKASDANTVTLGASRDIFVGDGVGTSISSPGSGVLVINNALQNKTGETGSWAKQGTGTLQLGGVSTYTGDTAINTGTLQLTTGNDRLPIETIVNVGQAASGNLGTFDLNGRNQQIAGLISTTGTNATTGNNTVTSTNAATLTLGGNGTYSFGDGSNANSGVISGAISLVKAGSGTQIFGDTNSYTGGTNINGGTLAISNASALGASGTISFGGGTLRYDSLTTDLSDRFSNAASQAYAVNTNGNDITFATALTSVDGTLTKSGSGTLTLSGTNSYTGATTVSAGTLVIDGNQSSATGAMTVASGATLGGSGTVGADTTFQSGSFHTPGNSPGIQTFHDAMLTYESGANFVWELVGNTTTQASVSPWNFDQVVLTGTSPLVFNANTSLVFNGAGSTVDWSNSFWTSNRSWLVFTGANSITGTFGSIIASADAVDGDTFTSSIGAFAWRAAGGDLFLDFTANVTAVPEPASWGGSLVLLGLWAARRRSARRKLV
jgi:autotransporter-associated beta strand protein